MRLHSPLAVLLLLSSCSNAPDTEESQIFAVVDGVEITAPMLDTALSRLPADVDRKDARIQKAALDQLVSETLLAEQARDAKLDRNPAVRRQIEAASRAVLAQSYLERSLSKVAPTDTDVVAFFSDHPYLFADRQRYDLQVIQVRGTPTSVRRYIDAFGAPGMTVAAIGDRMSRDGVAVVIDRDRSTGDQLPDPVARKLAASQPGTTFTYRIGDVQRFVQLVSSEPSPVPLALARPTIAMFLQEQRRQKQIAANLKRLRDGSKVDYRGVGKTIMTANDARPAEATAKTI